MLGHVGPSGEARLKRNAGFPSRFVNALDREKPILVTVSISLQRRGLARPRDQFLKVDDSSNIELVAEARDPARVLDGTKHLGIDWVSCYYQKLPGGTSCCK